MPSKGPDNSEGGDQPHHPSMKQSQEDWLARNRDASMLFQTQYEANVKQPMALSKKTVASLEEKMSGSKIVDSNIDPKTLAAPGYRNETANLAASSVSSAVEKTGTKDTSWLQHNDPKDESHTIVQERTRRRQNSREGDEDFHHQPLGQGHVENQQGIGNLERQQSYSSPGAHAIGGRDDVPSYAARPNAESEVYQDSDIPLVAFPVLTASDEVSGDDQTRQRILDEVKATAPQATIVNANTSDEKIRLLPLIGIAMLIVISAIVTSVIFVVRRQEEPPRFLTPSPTLVPSAAPTVSSMPTTFEWTELVRVNGTSNDVSFGAAAAISEDGKTVVVGASPNSVVRAYRIRTGETDSGDEATVLEQLGQTIFGLNTGDYFGGSAALSSNGTILAIGARFGGAESKGYVRVFRLVETNNDSTSGAGYQWSQIGGLISASDQDQKFGNVVGLSGDGLTVVSSSEAYNPDSNSSSTSENTGQVRVFRLQDGKFWRPMGQNITGERSGDFFGRGVAISSNGMVIAATGVFIDGTDDSSGRVEVLRWDESSELWIRRGAQAIRGRNSHYHVQNSISLSYDGNRIAIGSISPWNDEGDFGAGLLRIYRLLDDGNGSTWIQVGQDWNGGNRDFFGTSVAMSADGKTVAAGATQQFAILNTPGYVRTYREVGDNEWRVLGSDIVGHGNDDDFGWDVSLSGDGTMVFGGAPQFRSEGDLNIDIMGYALLHRAN